MLLDTTPSGSELQRKILLNHSSTLRSIFLISLILIPIALYIGILYSNTGRKTPVNKEHLKNVAMIVVDNHDNRSQGTAFLIAAPSGQPTGYLLTARHVVADATHNQVALMFPHILSEEEQPLITSASIVWTTDVSFDGADLQSLRYDVALLKLDDISVLPEDVSGFTVGIEMAIKDPIEIYGFPSSEGYANQGIISNIEYGGSTDLMVLGFQIDHGLSGAPVYCEETGEVLGIAIASKGGTDLGNIALKMSRVVDLLDRDGKSSLLFP